VNRLGISLEKTNLYIAQCKDSIKKAYEIKESINNRGEMYQGELAYALDNIASYEKMLKLLEDNKE
jgi:hypothetical protein